MATFTPLATSTDFNASAYADMAAHITTAELTRIMVAATRTCENACGRRLAPFDQLVETTRLQDGDVEDVLPVGLPLPMQAQMGIDYANALSMPALVRFFQVRNYPGTFPDLWTGAIESFTISWSVQISPFTVPAQAIQFFPDTGLGTFNIGTFVPPGATGVITYSGGYTTVPDDLKQAALDMAAWHLARMLDPNSFDRDPDKLRDEALKILVAYGAGRERK